MKRFQAIVGLCSAVALLLIVGCGGGEDDGAKAPQSGSDPVTLTVLSWQPNGPEFWDEVVRRFESEHPNIKIKQQVAPYANYGERVGTIQKSNSGPDVLVLDSGAAAAVTYNDLLQPIDKYVDSDTIADLKGQDFACRNLDCSEATTGLNISLQARPVYLNNKLLARFGGDPENPPATWPEFAAVCKKAVAAGVACIATGGKDYGGLLWYVAFVQGAASIDDCQALADGDIPGTDPKFQWPYDAWNIAARGNWFQKGAADATLGQRALSTFVRGEAVFYVGLLGGGGDWSRMTQLGDDLGVMPAPAPASNDPVPGLEPGPLSTSLDSAGGQTIGITKFTEHPEEAAAFAEFLVDPEIQLLMVNSGGAFPSSRSLDLEQVDDPVFAKLATLTDESEGTCAPHLPSTGTTPQIAGTQGILAGTTTPAEAAEAMEAAIAKGRPKG